MNIDITLPAELSIYTATATRQCWLASLAPSAPAATGLLCVDAADLAEIDGAGLQLLLSLQRSMAAQQRGMRLAQPSQALRDACHRAGLGATLLPEEAA